MISLALNLSVVWSGEFKLNFNLPKYVIAVFIEITELQQLGFSLAKLLAGARVGGPPGLVPDPGTK
jgi:hypothetical protein